MNQQEPMTDYVRELVYNRTNKSKNGEIGELKINHSVFYPDKTTNDIAGSVNHFRKKYPNRELVCRKGEKEGIEGVFVVRLEDKQ